MKNYVWALTQITGYSYLGHSMNDGNATVIAIVDTISLSKLYLYEKDRNHRITQNFFPFRTSTGMIQQIRIRIIRMMKFHHTVISRYDAHAK